MPSSARGQASVELVAVLPMIVAALLAACQLALAGHADWAASGAARAAARARAVGGDARLAARGALPGHLERRLRVHVGDDGEVEVTLRVPSLVRALNVGSVRSTARFEGQTQ